jgi:DNA-binding CsgD family transcriptional regulator
MTTIIFYYDEHTLSILRDQSPPEIVAEAIERGNSDLDPGLFPGCCWRATCQGELVIAVPVPVEEETGLPESPLAVPRYPHLTVRQRQVLHGLAAGESIKRIAVGLGIKSRTVIEHVWAVQRKLNARTREEMLLRAITLGLYGPEP